MAILTPKTITEGWILKIDFQPPYFTLIWLIDNSQFYQLPMLRQLVCYQADRLATHTNARHPFIQPPAYFLLSHKLNQAATNVPTIYLPIYRSIVLQPGQASQNPNRQMFVQLKIVNVSKTAHPAVRWLPMDPWTFWRLFFRSIADLNMLCVFWSGFSLPISYSTINLKVTCQPKEMPAMTARQRRVTREIFKQNWKIIQTIINT